MGKAVYLVTTKYNNKLFEDKKKREYLTHSDFLRDILLLEGGFFQSLWSYMSIKNELNPEIPLIEYVEKRLGGRKNFEKILDWWSYPENGTDEDAMNDIADMALGLIPGLSDSDRDIYKKLLTGFIRIELADVVLLVTHNWYNSGIFSFITYKEATKYIFVENLIKIAAEIEEVAATEIKLFLHDKDIIEHGDKDEPLKNCEIPDEYISRCPNLCNAIEKGNVRTFMHDSHRAKPSFFKNVLNKEEIICKSVLEGYFNDRIPPEISIIPGKCITIDISKIEDTEKYSCSTTEIINAIAEYQLTNKFELNAVEQNDEYKKTLEDIQEQNLLPVLAKGNRSLTNLQREDDGRALYLDSSIWIRYAQQNGDTAQDKKIEQGIVDFFAKYQDENLYNTANAKEVKEFQARLVKNSFLKSFSGGHYGEVTPFVFHSETEMNEFVYRDKTNSNKEIIDGSSLITKLFKYSQKVKKSKLDWRLLIVDDNAYQGNASPIESKVQKCKVIANVLKDDFYLKCENSKNSSPKCTHCEEFNKILQNGKQSLTINLECATGIEEAIAKLKKRRFDLILLDYLLGENENKNSRDYGTDLLRKLKRQYEDNILMKNQLSKDDAANLEKYIQAKGPFGKLWIFFISAFSNAISGKMLSDGMHYNTDYWHIARGACPTTTPELFRYNFLSLMKRQLDYITGIDEKKGYVSNEERDDVTLVDFLIFLFKEPGNVRMRTLKYFNSLLRLRARYDLLKKDYYMGGKENPEALKNGSPLVQALFPDMDCYSNAFWEHIQHLIYLIAYGNILQWKEMWDEYIFVKEILMKAEQETEIEGICKQIENYIIGIKSANFK